MTLTQAHKDAMRAGREAGLEAKRAEHAEAQERYMNWVRAEANAFRTKLAVRDEFGIDSGEYQDANHEWLAVFNTMPTPPPDSAWRR